MEQTVVKVTILIEDKMKLPNMQLEREHRLGRRDDHRHRPIIARFPMFGDREAVMRNATNFRGTKIYISEDLCPASKPSGIPSYQCSNKQNLKSKSHTLGIQS